MRPPADFSTTFPNISENQKAQLTQFAELLIGWNEHVNLISRKNTDEIWHQHLMHSLMLTKVVQFAKGQKVMDVGTGGGLPGIPLAIAFPETNFLLVDSIGKKIRVVQNMIREMGLSNVRAEQRRAEQVNDTFDFVVSRAVTRLPAFTQWVEKSIRSGNDATLPNGILYIKGGDFQEELKEIECPQRVWDMQQWNADPFFETKKIVWLGVKSR